MTPNRARLVRSAVVLVACGLGTTSAQAAEGACVVPGARVLVQNAQARVWRGPSEISACLRKHKPTFVGSVPWGDEDASPDTLNTRHVTLRGHYLAWEAVCACRDFPYRTVTRMDLRRRKAEIVRDTVKARTSGPARAIALRRDGALAWVAADLYADPPFREVWRADAGGVTRLDTGDIDSRLRIRDGRVFWRNTGVEVSAELR